MKMVPAAVAQMIECRKQEDASAVDLKLLGVHLAQLAAAFHTPLSSLTTSVFGEYLRNLDVAPRSKNNLRGSLGTFFKFCKARGWLPRDHDGVDLVPKFKEQPTGIKVFTVREVAVWLRHARPEMVPFLAIGAFAGLRTEESERLDWAHVHLADDFIEVKAMNEKTANRRLAPVTPKIKAWLQPLAKVASRVGSSRTRPSRLAGGWAT